MFRVNQNRALYDIIVVCSFMYFIVILLKKIKDSEMYHRAHS